MNEGSTSAVRLCILALVVLEVAVLVYKLPEEVGISRIGEVDVVLVLRNVHQVIAVAVAVDVAVIIEAIA